MDLGELLLSVRLTSTGALQGLQQLKEGMNSVKTTAASMQKSLENSGVGFGAATQAATAYGNKANMSLGSVSAAAKSAATDTIKSVKAISYSISDMYKQPVGVIKGFDATKANFAAEEKATLASNKAYQDRTKVLSGVVAATKDYTSANNELVNSYRKTNEKLKENADVLQRQRNIHNSLGKSIQENASQYRILAMYAVAAFAGITVAVKKGVDAFNAYNNAMKGLKSMALSTGIGFSEAQKFIEDYTKDGLIPAANAATALKNLLSRGYTDTQATDVLARLKDSAAFGRQASLTLGQAVESATEGLKNENSILVDNAGVTKNVSKMWEEFAKSIGKSVTELTKAEKIQAEYNGILYETRHQVGDAAKITAELAGSQAQLGQSTTMLWKEFGEALVPAVKAFMVLLTPMIRDITSFIKENKTLVMVITGVVTAISGLFALIVGGAALFGTLASAVSALGISLGALMINPVTLAIAAFAVVLGTVVYNTVKAKNAADEYRTAIARLNDTIARTDKLNLEGISKNEAAKYQGRLDELKKFVKEVDDINARQQERSSLTTTRWTPGALKEYEEDKARFEELIQLAKELDIPIHLKLEGSKELGVVRREIEAIEKALKMATRTTAVETEELFKNIAVKQKSIIESENLIETYKNATKGSNDWIEAEAKLAEIFPQFASLAGIKIDAIVTSLDVQKKASKQEFDLIKNSIKNQKDLAQASLDAAYIRIRANEAVVASGATSAESRAEALSYLAKYSAEIISLRGEIELFDALGTYKGVEDIRGIIPSRAKTDSGSKSVEQTAYEHAIEIYEHRKNLGQLTLKDEVSILNQIKDAHAKTTEEIWDADERIYKARVALSDKIVSDYEAARQTQSTTSDRWVAQQKIRNHEWEVEEIASYNRMIASHKEYLAKIEADENITADKKADIRAKETDTIEDLEDKIYSIKKKYIDDYVDDYIDSKETEIKASRDADLQKLKDKKEAIEKEYAQIDDLAKERERSKKLAELRAEESIRINAVTKEGLEELEKIREDIADIEADVEQERLETEKEAKLDALDKTISETENKYDKMISDLKSLRKQMEKETYSLAANVKDSMIDAQQSVANTLLDITQNTTSKISDLIQSTIKKTTQLQTSLKTGNITPNITNTPTQTKYWELDKNDRNYTEDRTMVVNINDSGDKILNGVDDIRDYGSELVTAALNAGRYGY